MSANSEWINGSVEEKCTYSLEFKYEGDLVVSDLVIIFGFFTSFP